MSEGANTEALVAPPPSPPGELPAALVRFLVGGQTCVVATLDDEGRPQTTLMTWVVARNSLTLALAADPRGRALQNLRARPAVAIEVLGDDLCFGLRGRAVVEKEALESTPFPCALVAVHIEEWRDHSVKGVRFVGPRYRFDAGKEHRSEAERAVFDELRGPRPTI
jgi:hypothetical protein